MELLVANSQADKGYSTQKLLKEKNAIQLLKTSLNIPSTQIIQTSELTEFEKEKEALNAKLIYCKAMLLKLEEKKNKWEKYVGLWDEKEKDFETKQAVLENELKENSKEQQAQVISPYVQSGAYSLF